MVIKNVLVATDFSPSSESALAYGRELARQFASRLRVIHVLSNICTQVFTGEPSVTATEVGRLQAKLGQRWRRRLEASITNEDRWRLGVTTVLPTGSVAREIVTYARSAEIDVIVMGTHGRAGIAHTLLGSVAEKVVRTACCPVLTVRYSERQFVVADPIRRHDDALTPVCSTRDTARHVEDKRMRSEGQSAGQNAKCSCMFVAPGSRDGD